MNWALETPMRVGDAVCGVIVAIDVRIHHRGQLVVGHGHKRPLLVLVWRRGEVTGLDLDGRRLERDEIDQRFPRAVSDLAARVEAVL